MIKLQIAIQFQLASVPKKSSKIAHLLKTKQRIICIYMYTMRMSISHLPCYCATLRQASRVLTSIYDHQLRAVGLRVTQFTLLQALQLSPGMRITDLVDVLAMEQSTLTRTLAILQSNGWVQVADRPSGREKCWELTPLGQDVYEQALTPWQQAQALIEERFGRERMAEMHTSMHALADCATV
jgi:DNA-binding MarR family transcriptional regulator